MGPRLVIHLDTHVAVWLYAERTTDIPASARRRLESDDIGISPMVRLELTYLHEFGRITDTAGTVIGELSSALALRESTAPFSAVVGHAVSLGWTRDPFDRVISAHALTDDAALLTADTVILANLRGAFWDD